MIFAHPHLRNAAGPRRSTRNRGSAVVFMILLMGVLVAGMVTSMGMLSGIQTQSSSVTLKRNAAFYAAEAGLQQCVWNMNNNATGWIATINGGGYQNISVSNGSKYSISIVGSPNWPAEPVTFKSVGSSSDGAGGYVQTQASVTVTNAVLAPGLAVGGNMADNGTLLINGGVEVVGSITRNGTMTQTNVTGLPPSSLEAMGNFTSNGTFVVPTGGNLLMNGSITSNGSVTLATGAAQAGSTITHNGTWSVPGGTTALSSPNLNFTPPTVDTASLIAQAQANGTVMFGGSLSSPTFDFTASPNGIIYVNGNTTINGTLKTKGSGTLIVKGTLLLNGNIGAAGTPAPLNLVTTSDMTFNGTIYMTGALCVGGVYTKNGATNITGVVVVQSNLVSNGAVTLTYPTSAVPSFISYSGAGGGNILVSNFSGATY